jgi:hypothetical protein
MNRLVISPLPHISNVKSSSRSSIQTRPGEISGWIWASFAEAIRPTASRAFTTITSRPPGAPHAMAEHEEEARTVMNSKLWAKAIHPVRGAAA